MPKDSLSINVNFNLRSLKPANKATAINCIIRYNNQRVVLSRVEKIEPKFWNNDSKKPRRSADNPRANEIEDNLDKYNAVIKEEFKKYLDEHNQYPPTDLFKQLCHKAIFPERYPSEEEKKPIQGFIQYLEQKKEDTEKGKRVLPSGKKYAPRTILSYGTTINVLKKFAAYCGKNDFAFTEIGIVFYNDLKEYLYAKEYTPNYFGTIIKNVKTFMTEALEERLHDTREYLSKYFATVHTETDAIYLDQAKLEALEKLDLSDKPRLDRVRDLFLVGCWTGLRFSDFYNIPPDSILVNTIIIKTKKTGEEVAIPIHPSVKRIIDKYEGKTWNSLPPGMSNQKLNEYLKDLGEEAGFKEEIQVKKTKGDKEIITKKPFYKLMTTHSARRSFASNMYRMDIPVYIIMSVTGHRTEKAFLKYIRTTPTEKAEIMREIWNRQQMKAV